MIRGAADVRERESETWQTGDPVVINKHHHTHSFLPQISLFLHFVLLAVVVVTLFSEVRTHPSQSWMTDWRLRLWLHQKWEGRINLSASPWFLPVCFPPFTRTRTSCYANPFDRLQTQGSKNEIYECDPSRTVNKSAKLSNVSCISDSDREEILGSVCVSDCITSGYPQNERLYNPVIKFLEKGF